MSHRRNYDRKIDISRDLNFYGLINTALYFAEAKQQPERKFIVKEIMMQMDPMEVDRVMKKMGSASMHYLKPEVYDYRDGKLYFCTHLQHLSLQSLMWIHKK